MIDSDRTHMTEGHRKLGKSRTGHSENIKRHDSLLIINFYTGQKADRTG